MAQHHFKRAENVVELQRSAQTNAGARALDLVHRAADVLSGIEEHARHSERRAEAAEHAHRELLADVDRKLAEACKAVKESQMRVEAYQDKLAALQCRAEAAEADACEARQALAMIEEAIHARLLFNDGLRAGQVARVA